MTAGTQEPEVSKTGIYRVTDRNGVPGALTTKPPERGYIEVQPGQPIPEAVAAELKGDKPEPTGPVTSSQVKRRG